MRLCRIVPWLASTSVLLAACLSDHQASQGTADEPTRPAEPTTPTEPGTPTQPTTPTEPTQPAALGPRPGFCPALSSTLTIPGRYEGRLSGSGIIDGMSCYSNTPGPEDHHLLELTEPTGVEVRVDYVEGHISSVLAIREVCNDVTSELWCNRRAETAGAQSLVRALLRPGTYEVVVDQSDWDWPYLGGRYDLSVAAFEAAPHARCEDAIDIADAVGQDTRYGAHPQTQHSCLTTSRPGLFYRATVPARSLLTVRALLPQGEELWLQAANACAPTMAAQCDYLGKRNPDGSLGVPNVSDDAIEVIVAAFDDANGEGTPFELTTEVEALLPNSVCEAAPAVSLDDLVVGSDLNLGGGLDEGPCGLDRPLYYTLTVPPLTRVVPEVEVADGGWLGATFQDGCDEAAWCSLSGQYINAEDTARDVVLAVSPPHYGALSNPFELSFAVSPVASNAVCDNAVNLDLGSPVSVDGAHGGPDDDNCHAYFGGRPLFHSVYVPAGEAVRVTATPSDPQRGFELAMVLRNSCGADDCDFGHFGMFQEDGASLDLVNDGHADRTFVFSTGLRFDAEGDNSYTLVATRLELDASTSAGQ